jgi:hypothetical protein
MWQESLCEFMAAGKQRERERERERGRRTRLHLLKPIKL